MLSRGEGKQRGLAEHLSKSGSREASPHTLLRATSVMLAQGKGLNLIAEFNQAEGDPLALGGQSYVARADGQRNVALDLSGVSVLLQGVPAATAPNPTWFA
jgi:hypothetical protein